MAQSDDISELREKKKKFVDSIKQFLVDFIILGVYKKPNSGGNSSLIYK